MDRFLKISDKDKRASFVKAEIDIGLSEDIIEKDFWVCWILKELFLLEEIKNHLTFKGGTSLSKIYKVISDWCLLTSPLQIDITHISCHSTKV